MCVLNSFECNILGGSKLSEIPNCYGETWDVVNPVCYCLNAPKAFFCKGARGLVKNNYSQLSKNKRFTDLRTLCAVRANILRSLGTCNSIADARNKTFQELCTFTEDESIRAVTVLKNLYTSITPGLITRINCLEQKIKRLTEYLVSTLELSPKEKVWVSEVFSLPPYKTITDVWNLSIAYCERLKSYPNNVWCNIRGYVVPVLFSDYNFMSVLYTDHKDVFSAWWKYKTPYVKISEIQNISEKYGAQGNFSESLSLVRSFITGYQALNQMYRAGKVTILIDTQNVNADYTNNFLHFYSDNFGAKECEVAVITSRRTANYAKKLDAIENVKVVTLTSTPLHVSKNNVDVGLVSHLMKYYYEDHCRNFVVISSDCDFLSLTSHLPDANMAYFGVEASMGKTAVEQAKREKMTFIPIDKLLEGMQQAKDIAIASYYYGMTERTLETVEIDLTPVVASLTKSLQRDGINISDDLPFRLLSNYLGMHRTWLTPKNKLRFADRKQREEYTV